METNSLPFKMKVRLPRVIAQLVEQEALDFGMSRNAFCNAIIRWAGGDKYKPDSSRIQAKVPSQKEGVLVTFDLNKASRSIYGGLQQRLGRSIGMQGMQEILLDVFSTYCDRPKFRREEEIFCDVFQTLQTAIQKSKRAQICYKSKVMLIEPAFFNRSSGQARSYLVAWDCESQNYRALRLVHIKDTCVLSENVEWINQDAETVQNFRDNFDPFLSYGQEVKARFSKQGLLDLAKRTTNRPTQIDAVEDVLTFQCSPAKAKVYFSGFLSQCEILSPPELREWFAQEFQKGLSLYANTPKQGTT